jgi:hypothetical protein
MDPTPHTLLTVDQFLRRRAELGAVSNLLDQFGDAMRGRAMFKTYDSWLAAYADFKREHFKGKLSPFQPLLWGCCAVAWPSYQLGLLGPKGPWGWRWHALAWWSEFNPDEAGILSERWFPTKGTDNGR